MNTAKKKSALFRATRRVLGLSLGVAAASGVGCGSDKPLGVDTEVDAGLTDPTPTKDSAPAATERPGTSARPSSTDTAPNPVPSLPRPPSSMTEAGAGSTSAAASVTSHPNTSASSSSSSPLSSSSAVSSATPEPSTDTGIDMPGDAGGVPDSGVNPVSQFNIELKFVVDVSDTVRAAFAAAQQRWELAITGDLPDVVLNTSGDCGGAELSGTIDDVAIFVDVRPIDGKGNVLGAARPCAIRTRSPSLPLGGLMQFDVADLEDFASAGRLEEVVLHEMAHVLGFGSLWQSHDLIAHVSPGDDASYDTAFTGSTAIDAFDQIGGLAYSGEKVPVENVGGEGTANGHWREDQLGEEIMTSYLSQVPGVLSSVTIASFADLGYEVDVSRAEDYSWPTVHLFSLSPAVPRIPLIEQRLTHPIWLVDSDGVVTGKLAD